MPKSVKRARMTTSGLCSTCVNDSFCTFPRMMEVPVMQCLEFQGEAGRDGTRVHHASSPRESEPVSREPGLCFWCESRQSCTFPKNPGGVWSCEEFR